MTIEEHLQESMESPAVRILGVLLSPITSLQATVRVCCAGLHDPVSSFKINYTSHAQEKGPE